MSRFVRASKYRHVYGHTGKKEFSIDNIKISNQAWDTNLAAASAEYLSVNWASAGGGAFAILPLPTPWGTAPHDLPYKLPDIIPLARGHTAPVLDTTWSPFNDSVVASGGEDGNILIWKVESHQFDGWATEHWQPIDFDPVQRFDASPRKIGQVLFHPTASHVLASATGEHIVKIWDLGNVDNGPRSILGGHTDTIQSLDFDPSGTLLVTTCRDRKIRLFDPRAGGDAVRTVEGHGGIKGARVVWMGDTGRIATTGFSKMSDRQLSIWDSGTLANIKTLSIDQSAGVTMPFWSDNGILFLAGKGDGNVRYYEYEADALHPLSEYKSSDPQRGMCFLPRRALNVAECEIARAFKITTTTSSGTIEPIAFVVPRKADSFQADIFPPAPSLEPSVDAAEFFASRKEIVRRVVDLNTGTTSASTGPLTLVPPTVPYTSDSLSAVTPITPSPLVPKSATLGSSTLSSSFTTSAPTPTSGGLAQATFSSSFKPTATQEYSVESDLSALADENARLNGELREARSQIRSLELQLEAMRANAQRAAKVLLDN
ncbi:Coronin-like protein crn1 [Serendipita sp. 400]|nr:Coronin-like protein crn1 [Serendipita sp. 400]